MNLVKFLIFDLGVQTLREWSNPLNWPEAWQIIQFIHLNTNKATKSMANKAEDSGDWKFSHFAKQDSGNETICIICNQTIAVLKEYNARRHSTHHAQQYDQYSG